MTSSTCSGRSGTSACSGFKVYGSVFQVDARYELLHPLGKGSYGIVCASKDRETNERVAIKKVSPMAKRTADARHTLREILLLQLLGRHPNIISLHNLAANVPDDALYLVMDLMDTDLHRVLQSSQPLSDAHAQYFMHQLLHGVRYLHDQGVIHRDLKPGNLLLTKTCRLKIADFGLARMMPHAQARAQPSSSTSSTDRPQSAPAFTAKAPPTFAPMTEHVVTRWYRAPELMLQPDGCYDQSVDMWSVGCIFAEILARKALFPGKNFMHQLTLIFDVIGTPPSDMATQLQSAQAQRFLKSLGKRTKASYRDLFPHASDDALDLLDRLLQFEPQQRLTARDALAHPYLQSIERKYKGSDPLPPPMRLDFSFDIKRMTKIELRTLILNEVETFRHAVAAQAHVPAQQSQPAVQSQLAASADPLQPHASHSARPSSAAAASSSSRVLCGPAALSMIHSSLRQPLDSTALLQSQRSGTAASTATAMTRESAAAPVTFGSHRPRIRMQCKPPVPRQTALTASQQGNDLVHVAANTAQSLLGMTAMTQDNEAQPMQPTQQQLSSEPIGPDADDVAEASATPQAAMQARLTPPQSRSEDGSVSPGPETSSEMADTRVEPAQDSSAAVPPAVTATTNAAAIAMSALEQRSKALMSAFHAATTATATTSAAVHDEVSSESDGEQQRMQAADEEHEQKHAFFHHKDPDALPSAAKAALVSTAHGRADFHNKRTAAAARPRATSAGPLRHPLGPRPASGNATTVRHLAPPTLVGSTKSLLRDQRSNNGQSLTESANQVVASMLTKRGASADDRTAVNEREEVDAAASTTKPPQQRSTTQLPTGTTKKPSKKLTVPRSPKFSVMSWQKKKDSAALPLPHMSHMSTATVAEGR